MIDFNTCPEEYRHWKLSFEGAVATLVMSVRQDEPFVEGYELKLNSYDLGVDIELADAVQRIRFEHPEVKVVVITSGLERVFCAGANIRMLASSSHPFKVNFCKYTNETRLAIEDASRGSGIRWIAALNGLAAGGGYELAIACDEIYLVDDGNSAVSLPEVPLLGVLPGTGGLTRLVDKRKVRRDHADVFSTLVEGVKGRRAKAWNLIDDSFPKSRFADAVQERARALVRASKRRAEGPGIELSPIRCEASDSRLAYRHLDVDIDRDERIATLTLRGPEGPQPTNPDAYLEAGDSCWVLQCFRELDHALCQLRFSFGEIGLLLLRTRGDRDALLEVERGLAAHRDHWLVHEILLFLARSLRRYELTSRSLFALVDQDSAFGGIFLELALAGDRIYMVDDAERPAGIAIGPLSGGLLPMSNGLTRLGSRFLADPARAEKLALEQPALDASEAEELGLVTFRVDELDWEDDIRIAVEERASLSPDALTGMEASLRFGGAETCDSKIFGRLSAWQNWIFTRPNATGETGALVRYGEPEDARFDWRRT
ncbi:MAG: 2,3-epoxybenzoyl-CoA dihydrolase [Planctomycetota bacterium]